MEIGRADRIRTCDLFVPNEALYQAEPHLEMLLFDLKEVVEVTGFEPAASSSRTKRSTKLSHTPNNKIYFTTKIAFMQVKFLSF